MFPIYVCYDSSLSEAQRKAVGRGVHEAGLIFETDVIYYGASNWNLTDRFKSADELVRSLSANSEGKINASILLDRMTETSKRWLEPGAFVLLTNYGFYTNKLQWCFGLARPATLVAALSLAPYRSLSTEDESLCIRRTLRHELGHLFGCAAGMGYNKTDITGMHCINPRCSMRQTGTLSDLLEAVHDEDPVRCFCAKCMHDKLQFRLAYERKAGMALTVPHRRRVS